MIDHLRRDYTDLCLVIGPSRMWTVDSYRVLSRQMPEVFLGYSVKLISVHHPKDVRGYNASKVVIYEPSKMSNQVSAWAMFALAAAPFPHLEFWIDSPRLKRMIKVGCCTSCNGSGKSWEPSTNGLCWDCQATGHSHKEDPICR